MFQTASPATSSTPFGAPRCYRAAALGPMRRLPVPSRHSSTPAALTPPPHLSPRAADEHAWQVDGLAAWITCLAPRPYGCKPSITGRWPFAWLSAWSAALGPPARFLLIIQ